jgi:hypothetical protein
MQPIIMNFSDIDSSSDRDPHRWTIVLGLPDATRQTVARFRNRQDAEDHLRVLQRFMPQAKFEVVFNSIEQEAVDNENCL